MEDRTKRVNRRTALKGLGLAGMAAGAASLSSLPSVPVSAFARSGREQGSLAERRGIEPFEIRVPDEALERLGRRLEEVRWPPDSPGDAWAYGTDRA